MMKKMKVPMRKCTGCQEMKNKKEMIRVLKTPEDEIVLDAQAERTAGALIFAFPGNAWIRP